jgi:dTMP kinase
MGRFEGRDRIEAEGLTFHRRARDGFLALAKADPDHYLVLDGRGDVDEIAAAIRARVEAL